jgi:Histone methylation protein DOT1
VSTTGRPVLPHNEIDRLHELRQFLDVVGDAQHLLLPEQLRTRLNLLDKLDALIGGLDLRGLNSFFDSELIMRARSIRYQLEAANETLYKAAHAEIALWGNSPALDRWLSELVRDGKAERPHPGLSFDLLDEIISGVLEFRGPGDTGILPSLEMTAYQPTPARHILDLIAGCGFSSDDVFVDLGSGLGHVPLLVCILAGIRTLGVEVQPDYAASAQETAHCLNLDRVQFIVEDARRTDLSDGTVFYMFTPFTGSILKEVVDRLHRQSKTRQIRICTLGPCTSILQGQTWLKVNQESDTERIAIFRSL